MKKRKTKQKAVSAVALSAMLLNVALPPGAVFASTDSSVEQKKPSNGFSADEVNRILSGLTAEQKANINKLTGAEHAEKIRLDKKDLIGSKKVNVIVQFKQDPAKIQIIKESLAKGGATANSQAFDNEYSDAKNKVKDSHANFKSFLNTQPKTSIVGGKTVKTEISITREFTDAFNGVALTLPANLVQKLAESPDVASVWSQVEYSLPDEGNSKTTATKSTSVGKPTSALSYLGIDKLQADGNTGVIKTGPRAGQKVKVGVLDTGIDYNHPDLYKVTHDENGKLYGGHDLVNNEGFDATGNIKYVDDHDPMETTYDDWAADKASSNPVWGTP
ncbi:hypothetical protein CN514_20285, partial [Bacillus sp. AFS001701]|uniref:protease inhibitor I9 family protein n=1 Tax=Bacillus sp. AFS001701 TaxID=2033480 RepID=UPI000BFAEC53